MSIPSSRENFRFENWAKTFECYPASYFSPASEKEVLEILAAARSKGKKIRVVGRGHSPSDLHCTAEWMVSIERLNKVLSVNQSRKEVTVQAGIYLHDLHKELDERLWAMPNIGSISEQSIAGAIATCSHGSSMRYGAISEQVVELVLITANGETISCSQHQNSTIFKAALVHLGALGVIVRVTLRVVDKFNLRQINTIATINEMLEIWEAGELWTSAEYVRCWWFPYSERVCISRLNQTKQQPFRSSRWLSLENIAFQTFQSLLYATRFIPSLIPALEKISFRASYGWKSGSSTTPLTEKSYQAMNMNCLYLQYVDEWSIPISNGPEAIRRLNSWIKGDAKTAGLPFDPKNVYVHAPIEIRVGKPDDAYLSTSGGVEVCWIGVIMYKPYNASIPYRTYFKAFEALMRSLGGRPHWAKEHCLGKKDLQKIYPKLDTWLEVRNRLDPDEMFANEYIRRHLLEENDETEIRERQRKFKRLRLSKI
ncbi:D-arabinono-1,4-lactone oxidase [Neolecta irregularis DAH-3]|uniref:D-arabinono-1,4-lactone oxidase n=1 Tax=Neolecta irregularis (strain DAH-3) TaxID=1198029 RepID=A0A1U7LV75_NEOID|nr:D-arabinono-1,4-lactone oxidase [Neolecta irregularis DAH-3]|eukprot:OLL26544.1 D-arabinono-1,4-lactone oxidase [Neolecta irregularis DAH-3]